MSVSMSVSTPKWVKFFTDAGLPLSVATKYAIKFTDHRIQSDMMTDLTKEILYDMGIKTMGDVIAILRHAKNVYDVSVEEKLLGTSVNEVGTSSAAPKRTVASSGVSSSNKGLSQTLALRLGTAQDKHNSSSVPATQIVSLKRPASSTVIQTAPKIRRLVMDEHSDDSNDNGIFKAKKMAIDSKKSVFSRLGNDGTESMFGRRGTNEQTQSNRTVSMSTLTTGSSLRAQSSKAMATVRPTNLVIRKSVSNTQSSHANLRNKIVLPPKSTSLRSVSESQNSMSVKNRLGISHANSFNPNIRPTKNQMTLTLNRPNNSTIVASQGKKLAMKRLGSSASNNTTISLKKTIFDRLGPMTL